MLNFSSLSFILFLSVGEENLFLYLLRFSAWGPANLTKADKTRKKRTIL